MPPVELLTRDDIAPLKKEVNELKGLVYKLITTNQNLIEHKAKHTPLLIHTTEAQHLLGISRWTMNELIKKGELKPIRLGGSKRGQKWFNINDLKRLAEQQ